MNSISFHDAKFGAQERDYAASIGVAKDSVLRQLHRLQFEAPRKIILLRQDPVGLGGQISRRILGLRLALFFNRTVVFTRDDDWPYAQSFERYFSSDVEPPQWDATPDFDFDEPERADVARFNFWKWSEDPAAPNQFFKTVPSCLEGIPEANLIYEGILFGFLRLRPSMASYVHDALSRLKIDDNVIGVHIRRGDKNVETPYIGIDVICAVTQRLLESTNKTKIFLATDDPKTHEKLGAKLGCEIIYDASESRYNNANHRFLMKHPELAEAETKTAIKNIMLLANCYMVVGQTNAHFATLAASMICARRCSINYGYLIPGDFTLRASKIRRTLFWIKKQPRILVKKLLPSLTVRAPRSQLK
jgi:hypothetical protein